VTTRRSASLLRLIADVPSQSIVASTPVSFQGTGIVPPDWSRLTRKWTQKDFIELSQ
jgi:hypothetical protein